jgi:hypothetical protein
MSLDKVSRCTHERSGTRLTAHVQGATIVDARRSRRTKDQTRKAWYAYYRQVRFARWLGFLRSDGDPIRAYRGVGVTN